MVTRLEPEPLDERADHLLVPMRDGIRLATDVYLPRGSGPFPTVLTRLPYDKCSRYAAVPWVAAYLAERGYAVVGQDVRGKVRSEGDTLAFVHEASDGYDAIEWIAAQPWCSGRVGTWGESYYGFTQWAAVASRHPALKAIVPRNTSTAIGTDWMCHGGVFNLNTMAWWAAHTWVDGGLYDFVPDWNVRPPAELVSSWLGGRRSESYDQWGRTEAHDAFWTARLYGGEPPSVGLAVPALHLGGWWDAFQRGQVLDFAAARATSSAPQHLVMDTTDHYLAEPALDGGPVFDFELASDEELAAAMPEYLDTTVAFYDRYLRGREAAAMPAVRWRLTWEGWRESPTWPPPDVEGLTLYLTGDGLVAEAGREETPQSWVHDPANPVPSLVADDFRSLLEPPDDRRVESRDDVLTFTSDEMRGPVDLAGPMAVDLAVSSSAPTMHVMAKLVDVFPDGRTFRVAQGASFVSKAGEERRALVDLGHTGYRVGGGHRLRLEIASSAYPRYLVHPGTDADPWTAERLVAAEQRLTRVGGTWGARLRLTVLRSK